MYAGRKLQSASIGGATTELPNGPDRSRGAEEPKGRGTRRMRGVFTDGGPGGNEAPRFCIATTAPGALWEANPGTQGVPRVAAFVVAVIKTETCFFHHNLTTSVMRNVLVYTHLWDIDFKSSFTSLWS